MKKGQVIADGAGTEAANWRSARNVLVAFMTWDGYNFEDAILISEQPGEGRRLHLDPHRGVRGRDPRDEARTRGVHPRHPERLRARAAQPRRARHRSASARASSPATSSSARSRPSRKTELSPEEKLLHAIFGRAGEDVKNDSLEVPAGRRGRRHRREAVQPPHGHLTDEQKQRARDARSPTYRGARCDDQHRRALQGDGRRARTRSCGTTMVDPSPAEASASRATSSATSSSSRSSRLRRRRGSSASAEAPRRRREVVYDRDLAAGSRHAQGREGAQARPPEARRRTAHRRAGDGQGLRRHQAHAVGRRQDGRPPRQQGRHRQDRARGGHAVPGGRHARSRSS